ncbi:hypothetical protein [Chryseobacterium sp. ERMR1:04]|uniref:hypothetical protein n=1 Tax=Chryseobacterium sp. ERMR1:04 TaxID=1705393 RepID=UPI0006C87A65|nr:hypothetical protein [Chryseobacterium sp. ERMR1:04]KPH13389.1 hypothetical protein AMQ68_13180 [Chryseobacterium sp. ERMR1:04]
MIKSPYNLVELDAKALLYYKDITAVFGLRAKLAATPNDELKPVMNYLHANLREILLGKPDRLEFHAALLEPMIDGAKAQYRAHNPVITLAGVQLTPAKMTVYINNWAKDSIKAIFNYDTDKTTSFTRRDNGAVAYRHAKRLAISACPYCNAQFTFTIRNKRIKTRPEFDHFLNKGRYPYLALSFYNLIPSCSLCNSGGLKGQKPFSITTHLHPFIDNIEGLYEFRTNIGAVDFLVNGDDFSLTLQPCLGVSRTARSRAEKSISVFAIEDRYSFHKDYAGEILTKAYVYNNSTIEALFTSFDIGGHNLFASPAEIKELIMGNFLHPDRFHKRILSKLTKDIAEEFGLTI